MSVASVIPSTLGWVFIADHEALVRILNEDAIFTSGNKSHDDVSHVISRLSAILQ